jgi:hypothetical protein
VKDNEIDGVLKAAQAPPGPESETLKRISESIRGSLWPVRPLPPKWVLSGGLILIGAAIALASAARAGFFGIEKMNPWQRGLIFSALSIFVVFAATEFVNAMIPGSWRRVSAGALLGIGTAALIGVFAVSFRDYRTDHFISAGVTCLVTGLLHAIPAGLLSWLLMRRGFAVNAVSAGLAAGTLAGLAGLGVLELHCSNFQAAHVLVWHTAVIPFSAGAGALAGWGLHLLRKANKYAHQISVTNVGNHDSGCCATAFQNTDRHILNGEFQTAASGSGRPVTLPLLIASDAKVSTAHFRPMRSFNRIVSALSAIRNFRVVISGLAVIRQ